MSKLKFVIPKEGFELVRTRIAEILADEIGNQFAYTGDEDLQYVLISVEGDTPFDKQEIINTMISVSLGEAKYTDRHAGQTGADYTFFLDIHTAAKSTQTTTGDAKAAIRAQRFAGLVRAILENPAYNTLGFAKPFIKRVWMDKFDIAAQVPADARYSSMIRLYFHVELPEVCQLKDAPLIEGYETIVTLGNTSLGYIYIGESYP